MRARIKGIRLECSNRRAHNTIIKYYEENPSLLNQEKKLSKERQSIIKNIPLKTMEKVITPIKLLGKKYLIMGKEHIISSLREAEIIINAKIVVL